MPGQELTRTLPPLLSLLCLCVSLSLSPLSDLILLVAIAPTNSSRPLILQLESMNVRMSP